MIRIYEVIEAICEKKFFMTSVLHKVCITQIYIWVMTCLREFKKKKKKKRVILIVFSFLPKHVHFI